MRASLAAAAIIVAGEAMAAVLPRNIHVADFRLFGDVGCSAQNLGVWTVIDTDIQAHPCTNLTETVKSVFLTDMNAGCKFSVFTDAGCSEGRRELAASQCGDSAGGWKSWAMTCA